MKEHPYVKEILTCISLANGEGMAKQPDICMAVVEALADYYSAATIALHATAPTPEQWAALDAAGAAVEALIGVPEGARK